MFWRSSRPATASEPPADGGTNALLVPAGLDLPPALGHLSYSRHRQNAERAGTTLVAAPAAGLAFDVDSPAHLAYAKKHVPGFARELAEWEQLVSLDVEQHAKS